MLVHPYNAHRHQNVIQSVVDKILMGKKVVAMITSSSLAEQVAAAGRDIGATVKLYTGQNMIRDEDGVTMYEMK